MDKIFARFYRFGNFYIHGSILGVIALYIIGMTTLAILTADNDALSACAGCFQMAAGLSK